MFVLLISTIPRYFYLSEYELLTAVTKGNQTTGNNPFGSVTPYVKCRWKEVPVAHSWTLTAQSYVQSHAPKKERIQWFGDLW